MKTKEDEKPTENKNVTTENSTEKPIVISESTTSD